MRENERRPEGDHLPPPLLSLFTNTLSARAAAAAYLINAAIDRLNRFVGDHPAGLK